MLKKLQLVTVMVVSTSVILSRMGRGREENGEREGREWGEGGKRMRRGREGNEEKEARVWGEGGKRMGRGREENGEREGRE